MDWFSGEEKPQPTVIKIETDDGWKLALWRMQPKTKRFSTPVLLFHGLCSQHATFHLSQEVSFMKALADEGFESFALDFRGTGRSERPGALEVLRWDFSIDDFIHHDALTAVRAVLAETGAAQLYLGGHSLGGLVCFGLLGTEPEAAARAAGLISFGGAALLGADGSLDNPPVQMLMSLMGVLSPFLVDNLWIPARPLAEALCHVPGWSVTLEAFMRWAGIWLWNPLNVSRQRVDAMLDEAVGDTSSNVIAQLATFAHAYDTFSFAGRAGLAKPSDYYVRNGKVSYAEHLRDITAPTLLVVGAGDRLVSPHNAQEIARRLGSTDLSTLLLAKEDDFCCDYGHVDMILGNAAPAEVYPRVLDWLMARAPRVY